MTTLCYSLESASSASPAQSLDNAADYIIASDESPSQPRFVFPAASPSPETSPPTYNTRQRRLYSAVETRTRSFSMAIEATDRIPRHAALPDFSFNPGASLPPVPGSQLLLSPPEFSHAPKVNPLPPRHGGHGHRRGASEFVGGRLREGSSIAVPSANGNQLESGHPLSLQLPSGRRGHRRGTSGTISTNDLPILVSPPLHNPFAGGRSRRAADGSPNIGPLDPVPPSTADKPLASLQSPSPAQHSPEAAKTSHIEATQTIPSISLEDPTEQKPPARTRVGFSDTLEFIPRPLSLVSTDTSSTVTARPDHSVSGSISSVITGLPHDRESLGSLCRVPTGELTESRPGTASAILDRPSDLRSPTRDNCLDGRRHSIHAGSGDSDAVVRIPDRPSPSKAPKRWSFFGLESLNSSGPPMRLRSDSSSSSISTARATGSGASDHGSDISTDGTEEIVETRKKGRKGGRKNRVRGWAGSILPRKSKGKKKLQAIRPPTPPAPMPQMDSEEDDDGHSTEPKQSAPPSRMVQIIMPQSFSRGRAADDASSSPMIDLDAALGPFNTPVSYNPEWEAAQHAADHLSMRRLHSAQGMRGFSGPGMHYHRRSESLPALPRFDTGRLFISRFGSTSTMADVFEEDEEDDGKVDNGSRCSSEVDKSSYLEPLHPTPPLSGLSVPVTDSLVKSQRIARPRSCEPTYGENLSAFGARPEFSGKPVRTVVMAEEPPSAPMMDTKARQGSQDSTGSAAVSLSSIPCLSDFPAADDVTMAYAYTPGGPTSSCTMSSAHPSPRSPISFDVQRMSTAPSSITDANSFHSLLMGEPGPEVRISVEYDIPSLTSSNSTMTRESTPMALSPPSRPTPRERRPMSVSAAFGRRRSSLVSLSRLINSSHGERNKSPAGSGRGNEVHQEKKKDQKPKGKPSRLSRMMHFWKPSKDDATTLH